MSERIGIFGGTFDPPHIAHLIAAQAIHEQLGLDRVLLVPAAVPPHKRDQEISSGAARLAMVEAAIGSDERFTVSDLELRRGGPSYTVDTLRALKEVHPDAELFLAVGADQLAEFGSWKDPDGIVGLATLVTFARAGRPPEPDGDWPVKPVDVPKMDISSTDLRRRVAEGKSIKFLVPQEVELVIRFEGLYQDAG